MSPDASSRRDAPDAARAPARPGRSQRMAALGYVAAATFVIVVSDTVTKLLAGAYPVGEIICLRAVFIMLIVLAFAARRGARQSLRVHDVKGQAWRALCYVGASSIIVAGLALLPLPLVTALSFASPFFITLLAVPILGERPGRARWIGVALGFAGILIIVRPFDESFQWAFLVPVVGAVASAGRDVLTRHLSKTETTYSMQFWSGLAIMLVGAATAPFGWIMPSAVDLLLFAAVGVIVTLAQWLLIEAFRRGEAAMVAPLKYLAMLWSVVFGYAVWGDLPDLWTIAGAAVIVGSALYVVRDETRGGRA